VSDILESVGLVAIVAGIVGFGAATLVLAVSRDVLATGRAKAVKALLIAILAVQFAASGMMYLSEFDVTQELFPEAEPYLNAVEDNLETLFPLIALGIVFSAYTAEQFLGHVELAEVHHARRRALQQQHDLLMDVVDAAHSGVLFVDSAGRIAFANDAAKRSLDLVEHPETGSVLEPPWNVEDSPPDVGPLASLVHSEPFDGVPVRLHWRSGSVAELRANGRPRFDSRGRLGGVIVTFDQPVVIAR
jgi:PAS domain-containing protein